MSIDTPTPDVLYTLSNASKTYGTGKNSVHALVAVNLILRSGEHVAVQGPTGGGKSTLLQLLGALDTPSSGEVEFCGEKLSTMSPARLNALRARKIGFIFQNYNLIPTMTAQENVEAALAPLRVAASERRRQAVAVLESVGLGDRLNHVPTELSGGQQQRVAIARALVKQPAVLLADEPTGNLDEETREEIMELLHRQASEHGITLITVTHDSSVAKRAQRRLHIKNGKLTEN
ncbi:MAG: ABC transporter ATP-binding protein [Ilumatobacteraceae bacterium]|nr:ABC transporter ATP-binding protein [Ilumatobacteraceae bacterium]